MLSEIVRLLLDRGADINRRDFNPKRGSEVTYPGPRLWLGIIPDRRLPVFDRVAFELLPRALERGSSPPDVAGGSNAITAVRILGLAAGNDAVDAENGLHFDVSESCLRQHRGQFPP